MKRPSPVERIRYAITVLHVFATSPAVGLAAAGLVLLPLPVTTADAPRKPGGPAPAIEKNAPTSLSTGPASEEERILLWNRAREQVREGDWVQADATLERLLFRYPAHPERLEARLLRGGVLLELKRADAAISVLREAWQWGEKAPQWSLPAGELLGRAWLERGRWTEAVLVSQELRYRTSKTTFASSELQTLARRSRAASWLIEAEARLARLKLDRVEGLLRTSAAERAQQPATENHAGFEAEADWLALAMKRERCRAGFDRIFSSEAAAFLSLNQAFLCERELLAATLREFTPPTVPVTTPIPAPLPFAFPGESHWLERTIEGQRAHLEKLVGFCRAPRATPPRGAESQQDRQRFRDELRDEMVERCRQESEDLLKVVSAATPFAIRLRGLIETAFAPLMPSENSTGVATLPTQGARQP